MPDFPPSTPFNAYYDRLILMLFNVHAVHQQLPRQINRQCHPSQPPTRCSMFPTWTEAFFKGATSVLAIECKRVERGPPCACACASCESFLTDPPSTFYVPRAHAEGGGGQGCCTREQGSVLWMRRAHWWKRLPINREQRTLYHWWCVV